LTVQITDVGDDAVAAPGDVAREERRRAAAGVEDVPEEDVEADIQAEDPLLGS